MSDKLKLMHQLIEEQRYREAREVLETEPDIAPEVAEKWLNWLQELHLDERREAGILMESKKLPAVQAEPPIGTALATVNVSILALFSWLIGSQIIQTPNMAAQSFFLLVALLIGIFGWQHAANKITSEHKLEAGIGIALFLFFSLVFGSRMPFVYYDDPPVRYVIAAFLLIYPALAWGGWHLGMRLGVLLAKARLNADQKS